MTTEEFVGQLERANKRIGGWEARCPAHEDRTASLSVSDGEDGKVLVRCHAGCDTTAVVLAMGLKMRDLFPEREQPQNQPPSHGVGKIVKKYDYRDEAGQLLMQVCRMEPKSFRQRRPNGNGWTWSVKGVRKVPYRLDDLVHIAPDRLVLLVEGEKDADNLWKAGLAATTNAGGAIKWSKEHAKHLEGHPVAILPDNDDAGRKHAEQVAQTLKGVASSVKVVDLPNLPPKGDVSDWLTAGGVADALLELVDVAPEWETTNLWQERLVYVDGTKNKLAKVEANVSLILTHDALWSGALVYDELAHRMRWARSPVKGLEGLAKDCHAVVLQEVLAAKWGVAFGRNVIIAGMDFAARQYGVHPVQDYLQGLCWDGQMRLPRWLNKYCGADDTDIHSKIGTWWMVSAVARAFDPGCQADHVMVLEGAQGVGKSSAIRVLGGQWYQPNLGSLNGKDCYETLAGHWIVEIAELDSIKGARASRVKDFVSATIDSFRPSYGRFVEDRPRQCVFVGTTNERNYLRDSTGGRRFWPVEVGLVDIEALKRVRDQLWAEAVARYRHGDTWWPDQAAAQQLAGLQDDRRQVDPWEPRLAAYLEARNGPVAGADLLHHLGVEVARQDKKTETRLGYIMHALGWRKQRTRAPGGKRRYSYYRPERRSLSLPVPTENACGGRNG